MIASTANYLWSAGDILGEGATSSVYLARKKRTGEQVAVKVFNVVSYGRPMTVQRREFDMLRQLDHNNIVKLFDIEELPSKHKVMVMEYCSGGSLLSLLGKPENAFGLEEQEFCIVLECVVNGMNHLRENGMVHRDIKPGNIMRQIGEDGRSIYKLGDFGAARPLDDDETFESLYGTEEYLHPDMYEYAVLRKPKMKAYGVCVDLWSIGVTFYHAATSRLPFRPFGGARKNKLVMFTITTEIPKDAISGVQREEGGPIEWGYDLPHDCQLSQGLRGQLVPVLAAILEPDQNRSWNFDQFFSATVDILKRVPVHIFFLMQASAHVIYIHKHSTASIFYEEVAEETGVQVELQHFLFLGHDLLLEPSMKIVNFPATSPSQPLMLLTRGTETHTGLLPIEPEIPVIPPKFDLKMDYKFTRGTLCVVHQYLRIVNDLHQNREQLLQGYYSYMMKMRKECDDAILIIRMLNMRLTPYNATAHKLLDHVQHNSYPPNESIQTRQGSQKLLPGYENGIRDCQNHLEHLHVELARYFEGLALDKSRQRMTNLLEKIEDIHQQYHNDRHYHEKLSYNEEQIHKYEKIQLSTHIRRLKWLYREDCIPKYQDLLESAAKWRRILCNMQVRLDDFGNFSRVLMANIEKCEEQQHKILDSILLQLQPDAAKQEAANPAKPKDQMVHRMYHLKEEMEFLVGELQSNNSILEMLSAVNSGQALPQSGPPMVESTPHLH